MRRNTLFGALAGLIIGVMVPLLQYGTLVALASQFTGVQVVAVSGGTSIGYWALPVLGGIGGLLAGWLALRGNGTGEGKRGTRAGIAFGIGMLIGVMLSFSGMLALLGSDPAVQEFVRMSEPHPEARAPVALIPWLGAGLGLLLGLVLGGQSLITATLGGLVADLLHGRGTARTHSAAISK